MRTLLLSLFICKAKGEAIPEAEIKELIECADGAKAKRALERLESVGWGGRTVGLIPPSFPINPIAPATT